MYENDSSIVHSLIFNNISAESVDELCTHGRKITLDSEEMIFRRGDEADELLILQEGVVELLFPVHVMGVTREVAMESKHTGDVVAWSAIIQPYHFTLSAQCASRCSLVGFQRDALLSFFKVNPVAGYQFMNNLAGVIGRRLQAMQMMWMHDLQASAAKRF